MVQMTYATAFTLMQQAGIPEADSEKAAQLMSLLDFRRPSPEDIDPPMSALQNFIAVYKPNPVLAMELLAKAEREQGK